jgi:putative phage-type endonuclease
VKKIDYYEIPDNHFKNYCEQIKFKTHEEWLKLRMNGIGGSDVSAILGHNKYRNAPDIYDSKMEYKEEETSYPIEYGNYFEPILFDTFKWKYSQEYETLNYKDVMFRNYFIPFCQASVDGVLVDKITNEVGLLEIKTAQGRKTHWYYDDGTEGVPREYLDQATHYFITTGVDFIVFYAQIDYKDRDDIDRDSEILKPRRINRKDMLDYMNVVTQEEINFWNNYVIKKERPPKRVVY